MFLLSQIGVFTAPGNTVITFILNSLNSSLKAAAKPLSPYFDATYAVEFLYGWSPATELINTILPFFFRF